MIDIKEIVKKYEYIKEASELMGIWGFHIENCDKELKIKVFKESTPTKHPYLGIANIGVKNPDQAGFYRSIRPQKTIEEALEDALDGFFAFWKPEISDQMNLKEYENW